MPSCPVAMTASVFVTAALSLALGGCALVDAPAIASPDAPEARIASPGAAPSEADGFSATSESSSATQPHAGSTKPADLLDKDTPPAAHWQAIERVLGVEGEEHDQVYTVTIPRDDWTILIEGMELPTAAGVASVFHFSRCPCGKTTVVGQFCVADYELNDVIDALRAAHIEIASVGPMLLHTRTNPQLVRFQAEGQTEPIASALREALRWTGAERMAPEPLTRPAEAE